MRPSAQLVLSTPSDRELAMTREFNAPRHLIFAAYTRPELLKRWLGVHAGWSLAVCDVDLRVGGSYRYIWRKPGAPEMGMGGKYLEIQAPERIVATERFDESWYPGEAVGTLVLTERAGRTTLTLTMEYESKEARDAVVRSPMEQGLVAGFKHLESLLATLDPAMR
jgi:uncharacterized protein YndB with AHSA1/START domain